MMKTIRRLSGSNPNTPERKSNGDGSRTTTERLDPVYDDRNGPSLDSSKEGNYNSNVNSNEIVWCFPAIMLVFFVLGLIVFFEYGMESDSLALIPYSNMIKSNTLLNLIIMKMKFKLVEIISISKIIFGNSGRIVTHLKAITAPLMQSNSIKSVVDTTTELVVSKSTVSTTTSSSTTTNNNGMIFDLNLDTPVLVGIVISIIAVAVVIIFRSNNDSDSDSTSKSYDSKNSGSNNSSNNSSSSGSSSTAQVTGTGRRSRRATTKQSM